jgi:hypothetical protein
VNDRGGADRWVLLAAAVGLVVVGYLLLKNDTSTRAASPDIPAVGKLVSRVNDVRRKTEQDLAWGQIPNQEKVFNRDHVFTGEKSQAEIELKNGARLSMNANSLIVIDDGSKKNDVELEVGSFLSKLRRGEILRLKRKNQTFELKGTSDDTEVVVNQVKEGNLSITVLSGAMKMEQAGQTTELKENQAMILRPEENAKPEIISFPLVLMSPKAGTIVWGESKDPIEFSWQAVAGAKTYELEWAENSDFTKGVVKKLVSTTSEKVSLPEGEIHWRVRVKDPKTIQCQSPNSFLSHFANHSPVLKSPQDHDVIESNSNSEFKLHLTWEFNAPFDSFEIEVARDAGFQSSVENKKSLSTEADLSIRESGELYWRVRALHHLNPHPSWSMVRSFVPKAPQAPSPAPSLSPASVPIVQVTPVPTPVLPERILKEASHPRLPAQEVKPPEEPTPSFEKPTQLNAEDEAASETSTQIAKATPVPDVILAKDSPEKNMAKFWFWLGIGENYQFYQQTIPSFGGDAKFQNIKGPAWLGRIGTQATHWGIDFSYKDTPGEIKSSDTTKVENGQYHWKTFTGEGLYRLSSSSHLNFRLGAQYHLVPFMRFRTSDETFEARQNSLTMATAGWSLLVWSVA